MPIYTYACPTCGEFEVEHSMKTKLLDCPTCKNPNVKRLIAKTNFVLVGGGWAKDNYS